MYLLAEPMTSGAYSLASPAAVRLPAAGGGHACPCAYFFGRPGYCWRRRRWCLATTAGAVRVQIYGGRRGWLGKAPAASAGSSGPRPLRSRRIMAIFVAAVRARRVVRGGMMNKKCEAL